MRKSNWTQKNTKTDDQKTAENHQSVCSVFINPQFQVYSTPQTAQVYTTAIFPAVKDFFKIPNMCITK